MSNVRGNAAIVGTAESDLGAVAPDMSPIDLMAQGTMRALDDCGLTLGDVDGDVDVDVDVDVNVDINNLERNVQTYRKETRLQSRAILTSGLMVSGAMTLDWSYNGLPVLSLGAFSIAAILGIPLIWTFLRNP